MPTLCFPYRFLIVSDSAYKSKGCTLSLKGLCSRTLCRCCGRSKGNYLSASYIFVKLLYIADVLGQIFALNYFLGQSYSMYGIDFIKEGFSSEHGWGESERFPRVTMCDVMVRRLGNNQRYTVQCVLPINLFTEKVYLFLWFWMMFVLIILFVSLFRWIFRLIFRVDRTRYVRKHLQFMGLLDHKGRPQLQHQTSMYMKDVPMETSLNSPTMTTPIVNAADSTSVPVDTVPLPHGMTQSERDIAKSLIESFAHDYLKADGMFVLRMLGHNTNPITATQFTYFLFQHYKKRELPAARAVKAANESDSDED